LHEQDKNKEVRVQKQERSENKIQKKKKVRKCNKALQKNSFDTITEAIT